MKIALTSIMLACLLIGGCKKENKPADSSSKLRTDAKVGFYAEVTGLPGISIINEQNANLLSSKSCSCDGTCTSASREFDVYIYQNGSSSFQLHIRLHKDRAANTAEFYTLKGKVPFVNYWFYDPIKLGTPVINGAEVELYHKSTNKSYYTDVEMVNSKNNDDAILNSKLLNSFFEITKFDGTILEGKVNCTLRALDKTTIVLTNAEFRASF